MTNIVPFFNVLSNNNGACRRAVKVLEKWTNKDGTIEEGFAVRIKREIATYQIMSGSLNVCCFYGAYETDKHLYLVTELCTGTSCHTIHYFPMPHKDR